MERWKKLLTSFIVGPKLYNLYTRDLEDIAYKHKVSAQIYADDGNYYLSFRPENKEIVGRQIEEFLEEIKKWMRHNYLKINVDKTKLIVFYIQKLNPDQCKIVISNDSGIIESTDVVKTGRC